VFPHYLLNSRKGSHATEKPVTLQNDLASRDKRSYYSLVGIGMSDRGKENVWLWGDSAITPSRNESDFLYSGEKPRARRGREDCPNGGGLLLRIPQLMSWVEGEISYLLGLTDYGGKKERPCLLNL